MGIDYIICKDCRVKQTLTIEGMVSMIKSLNLARQILNEEGVKAGRSPEEFRSMKFGHALMIPGRETKSENVGIDDLLNNAKPLEELKKHCDDCDLKNIGIYERSLNKNTYRDAYFCCYKSINYPISAKAEEWLAGVARSAIAEGGARKVLIDYILKENETGDWAKATRAYREHPFFELAAPLEIPVKTGLFNKKMINTDQLLTVVFGHKTLSTSLIWGLLELSGTYATMDSRPEKGAFPLITHTTNKEGKVRYMGFRDIYSKDDDTSTAQLKSFFRTMFVAYAFNYEMSLDT